MYRDLMHMGIYKLTQGYARIYRDIPRYVGICGSAFIPSMIIILVSGTLQKAPLIEKR